MRIVADGVDYEFDGSRLSVIEGMTVTEYVGCTLVQWREKVDNLRRLFVSTDPSDFKAVQAFVWIARRRAGERGLIADCDFDLATLDVVLSDSEIAAATAAQDAAAKTAAKSKSRRTASRPDPQAAAG